MQAATGSKGNYGFAMVQTGTLLWLLCQSGQGMEILPPFWSRCFAHALAAWPGRRRG